MPHPPHWPQPHPPAQDFDLFWVVRQLPPDPFPSETYDYGADIRFGPPGTRWVFSIESLINRETEPGVSQVAKAAAERLIRKLGTKLPPLGSTSWATPEPLGTPPGDNSPELNMTMRWINVALVAKLGTTEQVVHQLKFRNATTENPDMDSTALKTFGTQVRDAWIAFANHDISPLSASVKLWWPLTLEYQEVHTAYLEQSQGGPWIENVPGGGKVKHPGEKPTYLVPTQYTPFVAGSCKGTGNGPCLPWEVAMAITHNTNFRGPRFRGRTYLGPFITSAMDAAGTGLFTANLAEKIGGAFGDFLQAVQTASGQELHIVSQKFATSAKVTGTQVGHVPDSQRRRRRSQDETRVLVHGNPVGFF